MTKRYFAMIAAAATALTVSGCMINETKRVETRPAGNYEETTSSTDANGTTTHTTDYTTVSTNSDGTKRVVTKTKTTKDPKGLMNKTTTEQSKHVTQQR